jgi:hypothetical protein
MTNGNTQIPRHPHRNDVADNTRLLFSGGPPQRLETSLGLMRSGSPNFIRRALLAVAVGWAPLALLAAARGDLFPPDKADSFLLDFGVHTRFLVATPLLILAEPLCVPRLASIARHFLKGGLVASGDGGRYERAVASSQRLMNSRIVELAAIMLAYILAFALVKAAPPETIPAWHGRPGTFDASPAGWWALLVSLPLLLVLQLSWLWRICVWARFLWLMTRLPLQLIPAHPDHTGGLGFVGLSLQGFLPLAFTVGTIAAGPVLNQVVHHQAQPAQFKAVAIGAAAIVLVLCAGPLLLFVGRLVREHHHGTLEYSALATRMGEWFQVKWRSRPAQAADQMALDMSDFTGTNAANAIAQNAFAIRLLPLELRSVGLLVVVTILPFVPAAMATLPFATIIKKLSAFML